MADAAVHRYGGIAQGFHWVTVLLIAVMYGLGWTMTDLESADPSKFCLYQVHKSIGIVILVLVVLRLAWRLVRRPPAHPPHMAAWEKAAATGAHIALYGLLFLQPLLGILQSNAANFPIVFWGGFELPALIAPDKTVADILLETHHILASVLAGLILLHIAAALRHHVLLKDDVLRNMAPKPGLGIAVVALALLLIIPPFVLIDQGQPAASQADASTTALPIAEDEEEGTSAPPGDLWTVGEESALGFIALQQGSEVKGSFETFAAEIQFDPDDLANSRLDVDIDATSITTGHSDRDKTLNSPSFFDTATWPKAAFKSESITSTGDGRYEATGSLKIRDVTKDVVLPFTLEIEEDPSDPNNRLAHAQGELPIMRLDYGVGQGDWASTGTVANEVVITIDIKASKPADPAQPSG